MKDNAYTAFATLTYDEQHLPTISCSDVDDVPTLNYRDVQLFLKRFRKRLSKFDITLRYFICGEYGSHTLRPHYHCIFFFNGDTDTVLRNCIQFPSLFRDSWPHGTILDFQQLQSDGASSYCNKYLNKYYKVELLEGQSVEKSLKSQGIGRGYIDRYKAWHLADPENRFFIPFGKYKVGLPRYYKVKIFGLGEKLSTLEINEVYNRIRNNDIQKIQKLEHQWQLLGRPLKEMPDQLPLQNAPQELIDELEYYASLKQFKDKF